jgi:hypothetical protein
MTIESRVVLVAAFLIPLLGILAAGDPPSSRKNESSGLLFGIIVGKTAYHCRLPNGKNGMTPVELLSMGTDGEAEVKTTPLPLFFMRYYKDYPLRWRIAHGFFWAIQVSEPAPAQRGFSLLRIPMSDLPRLTERPNIDRSKSLIAAGRGPGTLDPYGVGGIEPLRSAYFDVDTSGKGEVAFDLIPLAENRCQLYIRTENLVRMFDYTFTYDKSRHDYAGKWVAEGSMNLEGSGPFWVFARGTSKYFATESGRLIEMKTKAAGESAAVELWSTRRPILALVVEADSSKVFAFGKDFRFQVADTIEPVACEALGPGRPSRDHAFGQLRECIRFLR